MSEPTTTQTGTPVSSDAYSASVGTDGAIQSPDIRERAIQYWTSVDTTLGAALRANLA
jgi:hypothetical protein